MPRSRVVRISLSILLSVTSQFAAAESFPAAYQCALNPLLTPPIGTALILQFPSGNNPTGGPFLMAYALQPVCTVGVKTSTGEINLLPSNADASVYYVQLPFSKVPLDSTPFVRNINACSAQFFENSVAAQTLPTIIYRVGQLDNLNISKSFCQGYFNTANLDQSQLVWNISFLPMVVPPGGQTPPTDHNKLVPEVTLTTQYANPKIYPIGSAGLTLSQVRAFYNAGNSQKLNDNYNYTFECNPVYPQPSLPVTFQ